MNKNINELNLDELVNFNRDAISNFCINKCKALCCKRGKLPINSTEEVNLIIDNKLNKNILTKKIIKTDVNYLLDLTNSCPKLDKNNSCKIHTNILRPRICKEFPIFQYFDYILIIEWCPAYKKGLFDNFIKELKRRKVKILNEPTN